MTIYVGIDGSEGADHALRWAIREADLRSTSVTAVVAWDLLNQRWATSDRSFSSTYGEEDALRALDTWVVGTVGADAATAVGRRAVCDLPWRALVEVSKGAELLVVGARGSGGFLGLRVGSVSERCLHVAQCPVAVIHAQSVEPAEEHIVVGVDGSTTSGRSLQWALDEARARKATVCAIAAWDAGSVMAYPYAGGALDPRVFEDAAEEILRTALAAADTHDVAVEPRLAPGGAASAILEAAKDATLVVVGTRGLSGVKSWLLGSTSRQVVHHAVCPVVVIPTENAPDDKGSVT